MAEQKKITLYKAATTRPTQTKFAQKQAATFRKKGNKRNPLQTSKNPRKDFSERKAGTTEKQTFKRRKQDKTLIMVWALGKITQVCYRLISYSHI